MKRFLAKLRIDRKLLLEFVFVFAAFLTMVMISSYYGTRIVNKNLASYGDEVLNSAAEVVKAYFGGYGITLRDVSFSVETLKNEGAGIDEIREDIVKWTERLLSEDGGYESFVSVYGIVDGVFIDGTHWEPVADFSPQARSWYSGAEEKDGEVYYSDLYTDTRTNETCITVSKVMKDKNARQFGVLAIDVYIGDITKFVNSMSLMDNGSGVLLDANRYIVAYPDENVIGTRLEDLNDGIGGYAEIAGILAGGKDISAHRYTNYTGEKSVIFFKELFNNWYIGVVSLSKVYYSDISTMRMLLLVVGFVLMVLLCAVLAYMHIEKNRSEEANRIKSSFLANMSHEMRTPMNVIIGMTELMQSENLSDRQQGYVNDINRASHSLLLVINDILDLSKIESGKLELNPVDYDFQLLIANICSMFIFIAQKKELKFIFEEEGDMPKCLFGDDIRLRQVLTNICGNAVKFTDKGYIRMKIISTDNTLTFEVEDTGRGISQEDLAKVFDPFTQADMKKNRNITGTGLGLPISKSFVEMMGGRISMSSVYGQGTVVTVEIPKITGGEKAALPENENSRATFFAPTAKVLVVDDNEINLKVAAGLLNLYGIHAATALSGKEGISLIKENDYDIVFIDHMMAEMDGIETAQEIRKLGGKYKNIKIVAFTANTIRGAKELFMSKGFDGFISKPINTDELIAILRKMLPAVEGDFIEAVKKIDEIHAEAGLRHVSGMEDMYWEAIRLFNEKLVSECEKMEGFLQAKDMGNLAISVHSMKSSLAVIGAEALAKEAFELEKAAKDKDLQYCEQYFPGFSAKLYALHQQLSAIC